MRKLLVGNAPCSWGTLEFEAVKGEQITFDRMLDELAETGYTGTELGDWGYMPTDPAALKAELARRGLVMLGAFVPVAMKYPAAHAAGIANAVKTARLLAAVATTPAPYLVLADNNGSEPDRTRMAGRLTQGSGLNAEEWKIFAGGAYVETPQEIATLLELTDPKRLGLVFDAGHYCYGTGQENCDVVAALNRFADRVWYIHLKDCQPQVARNARAGQWDYFTALKHGVFCELGKGCVDFPALLRWLTTRKYEGYTIVEQDILPGMGSPKESARRNREYLRSIESNFAWVN
jgi:inosose dehydratase